MGLINKNVKEQKNTKNKDVPSYEPHTNLKITEAQVKVVWRANQPKNRQFQLPGNGRYVQLNKYETALNFMQLAKT